MIAGLRRHPVASIVGAALLVLLVGAAIDLLRIRGDLESGRASLANLDLATVGDGLVPTVGSAADHLERADGRADRSPFLATLGVLPVVGDQVDGLRDLTEVTEQLGRVGRDAATAIDRDLTIAAGDPGARVDLLDTVLEQLDVIEETTAEIDVGASGRLVGPLVGARQKIVAELDSIPTRFAEARGYLRGMRRLLAGPSRYLLLAANNAEMRGGAGMPLSAGVISISDGDLDFGSSVPLSGLDVGEPEVEYPDEWRTTYRRWRPGRSYLSTAVSPNFPVTGPIYQAMAPTAGFGEVDGVLELDVVGLSYLLEVIGPVELDGFSYDADNIEEQVLFENYLHFDDASDRDERLEVQARLAKEIFDAFKERDVPVTALATALQRAADGRHLLANSADPDAQALWESIGADGSLHPAALMVTAQNVAANKQDWFLDPEVTLNVVPAVNGSWRARLTVTIANPVPERTSAYIDGSYRGLTGGTHLSMVAVYLPAAAYNVRSLDQRFSERGEDPPLRMFAKRVEIPRGEERRVAIEFFLPPEHGAAVILPSGRVRPVSYLVNGMPVTDAVPTPVFWFTPVEEDEAGAPAIAAMLAAAGAALLLVSSRRRLRVSDVRPLVAPSVVELRLVPLGLLLFLAAGGALVAGALIERWS